MALFSVPGIRVTGIASAVPRAAVDNLELDLMSGDERETFVKKVGIRMRRVAPPSVCASDLCVAAARGLFEETNERPEEVGALVFVTQTPDYLLPGNSMLAQKRLGLPQSTYLLDVNQGCAGYVYGLSTLSAIMHSARIRKGLLLVGDTITKLISDEDKSTLPIFSDAGSATLLEQTTGGDVISFNLGAEGGGASVIRVRDGGFRHPFGEGSLAAQDEGPGIRRAPGHLAMQGVDVLQYTFRHVTPNISELLDAAGYSVEEPDFYILHQANRLLNEGLAKKLGLSPEKTPESLADFGNTSSATIPITINHRLNGLLPGGRYRLLLSGFGVGFSWGSALAQFDSAACPPVIELT